MNTFNPLIQFFHFEQNYQLGILFDPSGCAPDRQTHAMVVPDFNLNELDEDGEPQYPPYVSICAKNFNEATVGQYKIFECDLFLIAQHHEYILGKYQERNKGKSQGMFSKNIKFGKSLGEFEQEVNQILAQKMFNAWQQYIQTKKNHLIANTNAGYASSYAHGQQAAGTSKNMFWLALLIPAALVLGAWLFKSQNNHYAFDASDPNQLVQETNNTLAQMGLTPPKAGNTNCLADPSQASASMQQPVAETGMEQISPIQNTTGAE